MPKKQKIDDPQAQKERFEKAVQELVDAGELDRTEADDRTSGLLRGLQKGTEKSSPPKAGGEQF